MRKFEIYVKVEQRMQEAKIEKYTIPAEDEDTAYNILKDALKEFQITFLKTRTAEIKEI